MAFTVIPIDPTDAHQAIEVELDGKTFVLELLWNTRGEFWTLTLLDAAGATLVSGVRLVAEWELLHQFNDDRLPAGYLLVVDMSDLKIDPTRDDLGKRVLLVYADDQ